jgi:hypothetical protein
MSFESFLAHAKLANDIDPKKNTWVTFFERLVRFPDGGDRNKFLGMVRKLDRELEPVSFLGGDGVTLGAIDLFVFAGLHEAGFYKLNQEEYNSVPNIARWYSHVEYLLRGCEGLQAFHINPEPAAKREKVEPPKKEEKKGEQQNKKGVAAVAAAAPVVGDEEWFSQLVTRKESFF